MGLGGSHSQGEEVASSNVLLRFAGLCTILQDRVVCSAEHVKPEFTKLEQCSRRFMRVCIYIYIYIYISISVCVCVFACAIKSCSMQVFIHTRPRKQDHSEVSKLAMFSEPLCTRA